MPIPIWSVGQVLAAADVNNWFVPIAAVKSGDTSRASTTAITADPDLSLTIPGSGTWRFDLFLAYEGGPGGSSDLQFTLTTAATLRFQLFGNNAGGTQADSSILRLGGTAYTLGTNNATILKAASCPGFVTATASGTLTFSWAQNTSNATATIVHAGSCMMLRHIS